MWEAETPCARSEGVITPPCHGGDRRFKSGRARHEFIKKISFPMEAYFRAIRYAAFGKSASTCACAITDSKDSRSAPVKYGAGLAPTT
jgi:hypothetical protein